MRVIEFLVNLTETVEEKLAEMDKDKQESFSGQIDKLESFPKKYGKPLKGRLHGYWQLRFADKYRIWYKVDEDNKTVTVEAIKHKDEAEKSY